MKSSKKPLDQVADIVAGWSEGTKWGYWAVLAHQGFPGAHVMALSLLNQRGGR